MNKREDIYFKMKIYFKMILFNCGDYVADK